MKFVLICLLFATVNGLVDYFRIEAGFGDDTRLPRKLFVDLGSSEGFVLGSANFPSCNKADVFDVGASKTAKRTGTFGYHYSNELNPNSSLVVGDVYEDTVTILGGAVKARFGVAKRVVGDKSILSFNGRTNAGRIGFSRKSGGSLRDAVLASRDWKILCLYVLARRGESTTSSRVTVGTYVYNRNNLYTQTEALASPQGLWKFRATQFAIGTFISRANYDATLTTTLDGILMPRNLFDKAIEVLYARYDANVRGYVNDCNRNHPIVLEVNKAFIPIDVSAFSKELGGGRCLLKLRTTEGNNIILGAPFFTNNGVCLNFQQNQLHFFDATDFPK